jgi:hypothetical protein
MRRARLRCGGAAPIAHASGTLVWPERSLLVVADLHAVLLGGGASTRCLITASTGPMPNACATFAASCGRKAEPGASYPPPAPDETDPEP